MPAERVPDTGELPFDSIYRHGFVRIAAAVASVRLGDIAHNVDRTIELAVTAHEDDVAVVGFPELGLAGYSNQDLFHQEALLSDVQHGIEQLCTATESLRPVVVVGAPLRIGHALYNVAIVLHRGSILGVVPKSYLPNYREFYEQRHFRAARDLTVDTVDVAGRHAVPVGTDLLFTAVDVDDLTIAVEICEDVWVPIPPSTYAAMAGATVLVNLSASNITVAKADYRRELCVAQSARTISAYLYTGAGPGESTTDLAWDGHAIIAENGTVLAETTRFDDAPHRATADVDLGRLIANRMRMTSFGDATHDHRLRLGHRRVPFRLEPPHDRVPLRREVARFPFVPADPSERDARCREVYDIQRVGLATRLQATGTDKVVIGVSGGLDSTQALLVAVRSMDALGRPRDNVLGYTLPGFATSATTLRNAHALMRTLGVTADEVDIRPAAQRMLEDLEHPAARGEPQYDVTYENVQAGARTSLLFRLANQHRALVVGTGDLSELALGWCTYGVGDQMSHYGVNASVPKTLVQHLVRWVAEHEDLTDDARDVLRAIVATEISPELVPSDADRERPHQRSEDIVGPYELQDFHLYHVLRFGYLPSKVAFLAEHAWHDRTHGVWPDAIPVAERHEYDRTTIAGWLDEFLRRFFATSQFKRSALPDGPKVGSGGSLSPRGDWRAPSDGHADAWLDELHRSLPTG